MRAICFLAAIALSALSPVAAQAGLSVFDAVDTFSYSGPGMVEAFVENPGGRVTAQLQARGVVKVYDLSEEFKRHWTDTVRDPITIGYDGEVRHGYDLDYFKLDPYYIRFYEGNIRYLQITSHYAPSPVMDRTHVWFRIWADYSAVPEPTTAGLLACGGFVLLGARARRRHG